MIVREDISPSSAEEWFFNPRTHHHFKANGCTKPFISLFEQGMLLDSTSRHFGLKKAIQSAREMMEECTQVIQKHMPPPTPDFEP